MALVGTSGAGKSTIASLVPRLYDVDSGAIRLNGVDVRDLRLASIRATLGMATQDGHLFHESVRSNLLLSRPEATEDELWAALHDARLDDLIRSLSDGLDTVVGERGYRLSGGERQRLTIARLLLARPQLVILDEATAHLDSTSEAAVQEALSVALAGRTSLVIAHRLSTVRAADLILVVEDGRIVERGTHTELYALGGRYEELYRTQFDRAPIARAGWSRRSRSSASRPSLVHAAELLGRYVLVGLVGVHRVAGAVVDRRDAELVNWATSVQPNFGLTSPPTVAANAADGRAARARAARRAPSRSRSARIPRRPPAGAGTRHPRCGRARTGS